MMLAVPASALALSHTATDTQAAASRAPLQVRVTPRRIQFNHPVTVTGLAPAPDAGRRVTVETTVPGDSSWRPLAATRIGPTGRFRLLARLRHSGLLRVVSASVGAPTGVPAGAAASPSAAVAQSLRAARAGQATPVTSRATPVAVTAQFSVTRRSVAVLSGGPVHVQGRLSPVRSNRQVRLQGRSRGHWRTLASGRTGSAGGFRLRFLAVNGQQGRLRVVFAGDATNAGAVQSVGSLTVYSQSLASWYDDSGATACGFHAGLGVANLSLPCGSRVGIRYGGRTVTATVDDRGPYVGGRGWDLNQNTAAALGFGGVGTVWVSLGGAR